PSERRATDPALLWRRGRCPRRGATPGGVRRLPLTLWLAAARAECGGRAAGSRPRRRLRPGSLAALAPSDWRQPFAVAATHRLAMGRRQRCFGDAPGFGVFGGPLPPVGAQPEVAAGGFPEFPVRRFPLRRA